MSNVFDAHPWLNGAVGALCMALVNGLIGKLRKVLTSPDRRAFDMLEARLTKKLEALELSMASGMTGLYKRLDDKTDALHERINRLIEGRSGGR